MNILAASLIVVSGLLVSTFDAHAQDKFQYRGKTMNKSAFTNAIAADARRKGMRNLTVINIGKDCSASMVCPDGSPAACSIKGASTSCLCDKALGCSCTVYLPNGDIDGEPAPCP